jgi:solute carrier family 13 (sodium-dependent dicarboxylate transporter), member 2/3/5
LTFGIGAYVVGVKSSGGETALTKTVRARRWYHHRLTQLGLCASIALIVGLVVPFRGSDPLAARMTAVTLLMAALWVFEVLPIPVTSLLPLVLLPVLGIAKLGGVAAAYGKPVIFLFLGGFVLALGLQRSGIHRRIALQIIRAIGGEPARIVLGFMVASAALSMWISNTASVMVMLPIATSVLHETSDDGAETMTPMATATMLGIAYAADIGGMATPIGTPPNLVLLELHRELLPNAPAISFAQWMALGLPISLTFMVGGWLLLTRVIFKLHREPVAAGPKTVGDALQALGPLRRDEKITGLVFAFAALLWLTGSDLRLGAELTVPGWRSLLALPEVGDASVAVGAAVFLFAVPSEDHEGETLMTWDETKAIPWGLLLLFGGGFALAGGFASSGLSALVGQSLAALEGVPVPVLVLVVCAVLTLLTEVTSNTATATLVLPILAGAAPGLGVHPMVLMVPATLSASCAFMMPVASPTQAIVFGSGYVSIRQMVRAGVWFNVLGVLLVTLVFVLIGERVFDLAAVP